MSHLCIQIQKELVSSLKKERAFQKGDCIIEQGGTANCLYILEQGECEVFKKVSEDPTVSNIIEAFFHSAMLITPTAAALCALPALLLAPAPVSHTL